MVWYLIIDHITPNFEYKIFMTSYTGFQLREKFCAGYMETKVLLLSILSFFPCTWQNRTHLKFYICPLLEVMIKIFFSLSFASYGAKSSGHLKG